MSTLAASAEGLLPRKGVRICFAKTYGTITN